VLDRVLDQGARPPLDPREAVPRFSTELQAYGVAAVTCDRYAGETFWFDFERAGIACHVSDRSASELYEAFEPLLNAHCVLLLDVPTLEQQLLGLCWRGGKITHPAGGHDDWACASCGAPLAADAAAPLSEDERVATLTSGRRAGDDEDVDLETGIEPDWSSEVLHEYEQGQSSEYGRIIRHARHRHDRHRPSRLRFLYTPTTEVVASWSPHIGVAAQRAHTRKGSVSPTRRRSAGCCWNDTRLQRSRISARRVAACISRYCDVAGSANGDGA
jgi:hypothetical protein